MTEFRDEYEFQSWANEILDKKDIHYVHVNRTHKYTRKGILDLMCWYYGKSFIIELKMPGKVPSEEQIKEMNEFIKHNIPVYFCYYKHEFIEVLKRECV